MTLSITHTVKAFKTERICVMKKSTLIVKRTICVFLAAVMSLCALTACNTKETEANTDEGTESMENMESMENVESMKKTVFASVGASDYAVVYAAEDGGMVREIAFDLQYSMKRLSQTDVALSDDSADATELEILVGNTNRPETAAAIEKMGDHDYIITMVEKKLVMYSEDPDAYGKMLNHLRNEGFTDTQFALPTDFSYAADMITTFVAEEKLEGNTRIDITFNYNHADAQAGLFIGRESESGKYGYEGYCVLVHDGAIVFYEMGSDLVKMGSKKVGKVKQGQDFSIRLEVEGKVGRAFFLDDSEGYEPWPEIELNLDDCSGASIGYLEISGYGTMYKNFSVNAFDAEKPAQTYTNAVYAGYADPDILCYDGKYYLYATGGTGGYDVHVSTDLVNWTKHPEKAVEPVLWGRTTNYWAPDVEYINGLFYMVVTCNESIGIAVSDSPLGPFTELHDSVLYTGAIDGHLFVDDDGKVYLYYVHFDNGNNIAGVRLNKKMQPLKHTWKMIITPREEWETRDGNITEGPYMLKHNGTYYLTYSGSNFINPEYAVGYATSQKPLGDFEKYDLNPIMVGNSQVSGAGHHCFTTTKDGSQLVIVYHTHYSPILPYFRNVCIDLARFSPVEGGIDRLEVYGPSITPQPYPDN